MAALAARKQEAVTLEPMQDTIAPRLRCSNCHYERAYYCDKAAVFDALDAARREYMRLSDENAKLRELVVEVFECARRGAACETCKVNNDGYACVYIMRELGVEVDG